MSDFFYIAPVFSRRISAWLNREKVRFLSDGFIEKAEDAARIKKIDEIFEKFANQDKMT